MQDKEACLFFGHLHVMEHVVQQLLNVLLHQQSVTWCFDQNMNEVKDAENKILKAKHFTCPDYAFT